MIFPVLKLEDVVQVNDQTRLDATKSYKTPDEAAITLVEIEPELEAGFIDVTSSKYLDYQYSSDGDKDVTVRITTDGVPTQLTKVLSINEIEIINCETGDSVDFFVLDSDTGTYTTVPNYPLNQFGFDVKCPNDFYRRLSNYDADLLQGMQLYLVYNSKSAKSVYVNYILHEVK